MQVGTRRVPAFAVALCHLVQAGTFLRRSVEIGIGRHAGLQGRFDEALRERVGRAQVADMQRTVAAVQGIAGQPGVVLAAAEVGQHVVEAPALATQCRPVIVVAAMAAHVQHAVDRRTAPQATPPGLVRAPAVQSGLRLGVVRVVARPGLGHGVGKANGRPHREVVVMRARLEQRHGRAPVFGQPCGHGAARRARPDHDVVKVRRRAGGAWCCVGMQLRVS
ncbi:hypothetical protein D3C81_672460 [compost metagenome]